MSGDQRDLKPVYLITSEHELLVEEALERLRARVVQADTSEIGVQYFSASSVTGEEIIGACNTISLLGGIRLVVVRGVEKAPAPLVEALVSYIADPCESTVLALVAGKIAKNARLYKAVDRAGGLVSRSLDKDELPRFIRNRFEAAGKQAESAAVDLIVRLAGSDLRLAVAEIAKVCAYVGEDSVVTRASIEAVTTLDVPARIWELTEAFANRDVPAAFDLVARLVEDGESEYALHAALVRTLRDLVAVHSLVARGVTSDKAVASVLGRQDWQVRRMIGQVRRFSSAELVALFERAAKAEGQMKTSRDTRLVLETWIAEAGR